jgi:hypothetical protein
MRWSDKTPREGQVRTVSRFLYFPLTLHGETRWWERVALRQEYLVGTYRTDRTGWTSTNFKE